jgi:hypothetical protein
MAGFLRGSILGVCLGIVALTALVAIGILVQAYSSVSPSQVQTMHDAVQRAVQRNASHERR